IRVSLGGVANVTNAISCVCLSLVLETLHQFGFCFLSTQSCQLLQATPLIGHQLVELLLTTRHGCLPSIEGGYLRRAVFLALLEQIVFAIQKGFALLNATFFSLDLFSSFA